MYRYQDSFSALGSDALITVVGEMDVQKAGRIFGSIREIISNYESRFSRFLPDSELNEFNRKAGRFCEVSNDMVALLRACKEMSHVSEGLFNPFVLPALQKAGYIGSWTADPKRAAEGTDYRDRKITDASEIALSGKKARIPEGTAIDFGGIGKGFLLDLLARRLEQETLEGYWMSLGGDILANGNDLDRSGWKVEIGAASGSGTVGAFETDGAMTAMATSGVTKRRGKHRGRSWHHLIDPETGAPADSEILTATVVADIGYKADVLAKCLVIGGVTVANDFYDGELLDAFLLQAKDHEVNLCFKKGAFV